MKQIITLTLCAFSLSLLAQEQSGKVIYEETIKVEIKLEGENAERMMAMMPKERKSLKELTFTPTTSLYKNAEVEEDEKSEEMHFSSHEGEAVVRIQYARPDNTTFINLDDRILSEKREFMGKNFMIKEDLGKKKWKVTGEQKMIQDYMCHQAKFVDGENTTIVWFTPQINVQAGPENFAGLPGLVLEVNVNDGKRIITFKSIEFVDIEEKQMKAPKGGKEVTREEFNALMAEKMKEMGEGGNRVIIKTMH